MPNIKPLDQAELAVSAVEFKLESMISELRGLMKAANIARCDAFDRAVVAMDHKAETQGPKFTRIGEEFQVQNYVVRKLENVAQVTADTLESIQAARERYRTTRERGELEELLGLFEAEDKKTKTKE